MQAFALVCVCIHTQTIINVKRDPQSLTANLFLSVSACMNIEVCLSTWPATSLGSSGLPKELELDRVKVNQIFKSKYYDDITVASENDEKNRRYFVQQKGIDTSYSSACVSLGGLGD